MNPQHFRLTRTDQANSRSFCSHSIGPLYSPDIGPHARSLAAGAHKFPHRVQHLSTPPPHREKYLLFFAQHLPAGACLACPQPHFPLSHFPVCPTLKYWIFLLQDLSELKFRTPNLHAKVNYSIFTNPPRHIYTNSPQEFTILYIIYLHKNP